MILEKRVKKKLPLCHILAQESLQAANLDFTASGHAQTYGYKDDKLAFEIKIARAQNFKP